MSGLTCRSCSHCNGAEHGPRGWVVDCDLQGVRPAMPSVECSAFVREPGTDEGHWPEDEKAEAAQ